MESIFFIVILLSHHVIFSGAISEEAKCRVQPAENMTQRGQASVIVTLLNNAENLIKDAKKYASIETSPDSMPSCTQPMDCFDIFWNDPTSKGGIYRIWPRSRMSSGSISVYCDMEDDGGAWTVIQRRGDFDSGQDYFYQDWAAYKSGFGNLLKDFWIGNDNIFALTNQRYSTVKFTLTDWESVKTYATYDEFWIDEELNKYRMHVNGYRGTAGDSFSSTNGRLFTTKDQDNDSHDKNCAVQFKGAWWYTGCHESNLNGLYLKGLHESHANGVNWKHFKGYNYSLKDTVIKIRPKEFKTTKIFTTPE